MRCRDGSKQGKLETVHAQVLESQSSRVKALAQLELQSLKLGPTKHECDCTALHDTT